MFGELLITLYKLFFLPKKNSKFWVVIVNVDKKNKIEEKKHDYIPVDIRIEFKR